MLSRTVVVQRRMSPSDFKHASQHKDYGINWGLLPIRPPWNLHVQTTPDGMTRELACIDRYSILIAAQVGTRVRAKAEVRWPASSPILLRWDGTCLTKATCAVYYAARQPDPSIIVVAEGLRCCGVRLVFSWKMRLAATRQPRIGMCILWENDGVLGQISCFPRCSCFSRPFLVSGYSSPVALRTIKDTARGPLLLDEAARDTALARNVILRCIKINKSLNWIVLEFSF